MRKASIWWGVSFIVVAILIILNIVGVSLGVVAGISVIDILLGGACLAWIFVSIFKGPIWPVFFPIAFLFMIFKEEIAIYSKVDAINSVSNWLVLLCAALLGLGTMFMTGFRGRRNKAARTVHYSINTDGDYSEPKMKVETDTTNTAGDNGEQTFKAEAKTTKAFERSTRYIDCTDFVSESIEVNVGGCEIFFENKENYAGGATLNVEVNVGSLTINVPSEWKIVPHVANNIGKVNLPTGSPEGKILNIVGENNVGQIEIKLV